MDLATVFAVLSKGGPIGLAAITLCMWWLERRERQQMTEKLFDLSTASVNASAKTEAALNEFSKTLDRIRDRIE